MKSLVDLTWNWFGIDLKSSGNLVEIWLKSDQNRLVLVCEFLVCTWSCLAMFCLGEILETSLVVFV